MDCRLPSDASLWIVRSRTGSLPSCLEEDDSGGEGSPVPLLVQGSNISRLGGTRSDGVSHTGKEKASSHECVKEKASSHECVKEKASSHECVKEKASSHECVKEKASSHECVRACALHADCVDTYRHADSREGTCMATTLDMDQPSSGSSTHHKNEALLHRGIIIIRL
jgi:hypothetical protein